MKQIIDEYGTALLALVAAIGVLALTAVLLLRPGSVVSQGVERMTDQYLSDELPASTQAIGEFYATAPVEIRVAKTATVGKTTDISDLFCGKEGETLSHIRVLSDGEGAWTVEGNDITFSKRGTYAMRIYAEDATGNYGTSTLWMNVGGVA